MGAPAAVELSGVSHFFGHGALRRRILDDVHVRLEEGEIVIVTGPSGGGKTTLLTLIGGLRSVQEGSVRVLGEELRGAAARTLRSIRRRIGYIFQAHNLIDALTASQNAQMSLLLDRRISKREARRRANEMLETVGLGDRLHHHPSQLSGGQRQRVAIARALARAPRLVLADEPTASLDRQSGRDVVDLLQDLARRQRTTVLLVTHDSRILDIADRIVHLEDGRLTSFTQSVADNTRQMTKMLAENLRKGDLMRRLESSDPEEFSRLLEEVTRESQGFLDAMALGEDQAFQSMLEQVLQGFTFQFGRLLDAERASVFLVDAKRGELWLKVAEEAGGGLVDLRIPISSGIAGRVASTGVPMRVDDAASHPQFNPSIDEATGFRTRSVLCVPIRDREGQVFAVAQLLNRKNGEPFDEADERRFQSFADSIGVVLESWSRMARRAETPTQRDEQ